MICILKIIEEMSSVHISVIDPVVIAISSFGFASWTFFSVYDVLDHPEGEMAGSRSMIRSVNAGIVCGLVLGQLLKYMDN